MKPWLLASGVRMFVGCRSRRARRQFAPEQLQMSRHTGHSHPGSASTRRMSSPMRAARHAPHLQDSSDLNSPSCVFKNMISDLILCGALIYGASQCCIARLLASASLMCT